jgi:hypothetical protein
VLEVVVIHTDRMRRDARGARLAQSETIEAGAARLASIGLNFDLTEPYGGTWLDPTAPALSVPTVNSPHAPPHSRMIHTLLRSAHRGHA